jgi:hypothetical protein
VRVRFDGAAKGAIEKVDVEITSVVVAGDQPLLIQPVLIATDNRLWLTIGAAPAGAFAVAPQAWRIEEVEPQWDRLILRSDDRETPFADFEKPRDLIVRVTGHKRLGVGVAILCGGPPSAAAPKPGHVAKAVLEDPVLGRRLTHDYRRPPQ